ncbi:MAG: TetR/AcrR family transcriptional regulator C-terminal domain-containing protein [Clostridiales bacterium]|nr:TetR/AcrR family transcriptional regulator C-terminal domain-containing protein [Clostridiales bacterium]
MAIMTKELIIQTVFELLNERPFTKITVKDIMERCGINRNTFYYHFRDITDVMEYAFKREMDRIMKGAMEVPPRSCDAQSVPEEHSALPETAENMVKGLTQIVDMLQENKRAILHIYRSLDRAVLQHQLEQLCDYMVSNYVLPVDQMSEMQKLSEEDLRLIRNLQKCTLEGVLLDWLEHGMREDLAEGMRRSLELLRQASDERRPG